MDGNIRLGKIWGIPVGLHWSWFIIFIFITWSLVGMFTLIQNPPLATQDALVVAIITSFLFFASVMAHEFGHALAARKYHIPVRSISLFLFGGMAQIGQEPETPKAEFTIAIAGPVASLLLAGFFWLVQFLFPATPDVSIPAVWLARINLLLAGFNMIPGYPLDGGRVFRAALWHYSRSYSKAHKISAIAGRLVAFCFIAYGIFSIVGGNTLSGLWMAFIGWYLNSAASSTPIPSPEVPILSNIRVSQVMEASLRTIPAAMSVKKVVLDLFIPHGFDVFTVMENAKPVGILTMHNISAIPRMDWDSTAASQVMVPFERIAQVPADMDIQAALRKMDQNNLPHVTVRDGDRFTGVITRDQIHHYLRLLGELGV